MEFTESIRHIVLKIAQGETSATELVEHCLSRIKQHNSTINAIVTLNEREALAAAAKLADMMQNTNNLSPILTT